MPLTFSYELTESNIYAHLLYRIHAKDAIKFDETNFLDVLKKAAQIANKDLKHSDCNILVFADPDQTIPEEGLGGRAWGSDWIRMDIDPDTKLGVNKAIQTYLPGMVAHELHHTRRATSVGYGETLGEAMVSEGLAQAYQEFLYPEVNAMYAHHLTADEIKNAWEKAQRELASKDYSHSEWFFGTGKLKRWTAYSLGYDIVKQFMESKGEDNPAALVDVTANFFLEKYNLPGSPKRELS